MPKKAAAFLGTRSPPRARVCASSPREARAPRPSGRARPPQLALALEHPVVHRLGVEPELPAGLGYGAPRGDDVVGCLPPELVGVLLLIGDHEAILPSIGLYAV